MRIANVAIIATATATVGNGRAYSSSGQNGIGCIVEERQELRQKSACRDASAVLRGLEPA